MAELPLATYSNMQRPAAERESETHQARWGVGASRIGPQADDCELRRGTVWAHGVEQP